MGGYTFFAIVVVCITVDSMYANYLKVKGKKK